MIKHETRFQLSITSSINNQNLASCLSFVLYLIICLSRCAFGQGFTRLVNKSQCYLYHAIIFKSREIGVKIGLSEFFGVFGLLVGFGNWRQTAGNAFTIGF